MTPYTTTGLGKVSTRAFRDRCLMLEYQFGGEHTYTWRPSVFNLDSFDICDLLYIITFLL